MEQEMAYTLLQLNQPDSSGMAPRQMIQAGGGTASPQLTPADDPPQCDLEQLNRRLADLKFPEKLYNVVNCDPLYKSIRWNGQGTAVVIPSRRNFDKYGLSLLCRGSYRSFKRQMNEYGFKIEKSTASDVDEYVHEKKFFLRGQKQLLRNIHRRQTLAKRRALAEGTEKLVPDDGPLTSPGANVTPLHANLTSVAANSTSIKGCVTSPGANLTPPQANRYSVAANSTSIRDNVTSPRANVTPLQANLTSAVASLAAELTPLKDRFQAVMLQLAMLQEVVDSLANAT